MLINWSVKFYLVNIYAKTWSQIWCQVKYMITLADIGLKQLRYTPALLASAPLSRRSETHSRWPFVDAISWGKHFDRQFSNITSITKVVLIAKPKWNNLLEAMYCSWNITLLRLMIICHGLIAFSNSAVMWRLSKAHITVSSSCNPSGWQMSL